MTVLNLLNLAPVIEPAHPKDLTYNGKLPDSDVIVELVWHPGGNEILERRCTWLTPCEITASRIGDELEDYLTPVFDDLPTRGVWRVVAAGTVNTSSYDMEWGVEHDSWMDWDILSANKFPCFGSLKAWFKMWKAEQ